MPKPMQGLTRWFKEEWIDVRTGKPCGRKKGETRLDFNTEEVIEEIINSHYLTKQKPSVQSTITKILDECTKRNIPLPSKNTIRNRIHKLVHRWS